MESDCDSNRPAAFRRELLDNKQRRCSEQKAVVLSETMSGAVILRMKQTCKMQYAVVTLDQNKVQHKAHAACNDAKLGSTLRLFAAETESR